MKIFFPLTLIMCLCTEVSFSIPAKPFKLLNTKEYKSLPVNFLTEYESVIDRRFTNPFVEPTKVMANAKISLKVIPNEDFRAKVSWVNAIGHQTKRYVIQVSNDREIFYDLKEVAVENVTEERFLYTFIDPRMSVGTKYYRIMEEEENDKITYYAPVKITFDAIPAPREIIKCVQTEENNTIQIKVPNNNIVAILTTESGMGIPCDYFYNDLTQTGVLKPIYYLTAGNYYLKIRVGGLESKYILTLADLVGFQF
jgi:hypothetical protein